MAKIISPRITTSTTSLLFPSPLPQKSLFPSQSFVNSTNSITTPRFRLKLNRPSLMVEASSAAASSSVVPDDISDVLGEVSIFTAAGEPVQLKHLWDQQEGIAVVALLRHFGCFCCWELAASLKEAKVKFDSAGVKLIAVGVGTPDKARLLAERVIPLSFFFLLPMNLSMCKKTRLNAFFGVLSLFFRIRFIIFAWSCRFADLLLSHVSITISAKLPFPMESLYADPDRKAYDVLGLYYGFRRTFLNPASTKVFSRYEELKKAMKNYTIKATPDDTSSVLQQGGMLVFKGKQLLYARKDEGTGDHAPLDEIFDICCKVPTP
ncbi:hypothetical protein SASPL_138067 [Salvia splendens]|uniref:Uncharacterized protein n=1 Tax=Salvia splendens TaxID=180675 RepID=A0A8X8ZE16_SALSN|nr:hypothetical protein SASPL_138067 [Salvia splendens]